MSELNINLPPLDVWVLRDRIYEHEEGKPGFVPALLISATSIPGQALYFQVLLRDGTLYERLTVADLFHRDHNTINFRLRELQWWDCPSVHVVYTSFDNLVGAKVKWRTPKNRVTGISFTGEGSYVETFDWHSHPISEQTGDFGHKSLHLLKVNGGRFALVPNNGVIFNVPAWTDKLETDGKVRQNSRVERIEGDSWQHILD